MSNDIFEPALKMSGFVYEGISRRDYIAIAAMQGLLANHAIMDNGSQSNVEWIAEHAYKMADAMLEARALNE